MSTCSCDFDTVCNGLGTLRCAVCGVERECPGCGYCKMDEYDELADGDYGEDEPSDATSEDEA